MNWFNLHPRITEAGNGTLLAMAFAMLAFLAFYVLRKWFERPNLQSFKTFHQSYETRAALGMTTFFFGFCMKSWSEWWFLHLQSHGERPDYPMIVPAFVVGTITSLWGMACLLSALSRYDWGPSRWILICAAALAFGTTFAM